MPRYNHLGPQGLGPMTGRRQGLCGKSSSEPFESMGRGRMNRYRQDLTLQEEKEILESRLKSITNALNRKE